MSRDALVAAYRLAFRPTFSSRSLAAERESLGETRQSLHYTRHKGVLSSHCPRLGGAGFPLLVKAVSAAWPVGSQCSPYRIGDVCGSQSASSDSGEDCVGCDRVDTYSVGKSTPRVAEIGQFFFIFYFYYC